jgi:hypothetical protein
MTDIDRFRERLPVNTSGFPPMIGLTDILYQRHRETIASRPPDLEAAGLG